MKKAEAISILATSARPREPKDRARYDEAVKMAIEALKCSETPKSSEQTAESTQNVSDEDLNWAIPSARSNLVPASVVAGIGQELLHLEEDMHRITQLTGISIDDLLDLLAQGYELKAPSAQPEQRWIPCSERLPERADDVIICYKAGDYTLVSTGRYLYKFKMWYVDVAGDLRDGVTAWMPLPEPYRGGEE